MAEQAGRGQRTFRGGGCRLSGGSEHRIDVAQLGMATRESGQFLGGIVARTRKEGK